MTRILERWRKLPEPLRYYLSYAIAFTVLALIVFSLFLVKGKGFVWANDGLYQHFNTFMYIGEWARSVLASIFSGSPEIPMYELSIGYGGDVITTLSYYTFGDPFAFLSAFFPQEYAEIGYVFAILLRYFFAGIAFSVFARKMGCSRLGALCGALMYTFCAFSLYAGVRHPYFLDPMIWMPLIFFGFEKILARESPIPYIVFVFAMTISNFYFLYMVLILTALYGICRLFISPYMGSAKQTVGLVFKLVLYTALGVGLGCVIFLPTAMAFLSNTRVSDTYQFDMFYSSDFYRSLFSRMVTYKSAGVWDFVGMAPLCWLGVIGFLLKRTRERGFKVYFTILFFMLLLPFVGHVMNGMGYVTNRWVFAWSFWSAFLFAKGFPYLLEPSRREKIYLSAACLLYVVLAIFGVSGGLLKDVVIEVIGCAILLACLILVWAFPCTKEVKLGSIAIAKDRIIRLGYLIATGLCVSWMAISLFWSYTSEFAKCGEAADRLEGITANYTEHFGGEEFFRLDRDVTIPRQYNFPLTSDISATSYYWSLANPSVVEFLDENSAFSDIDYRPLGLTSRSMLLPLVSAKYHINVPTEAAKIPFTFEKIDADDNTVLYTTQYSLPFGYTYDSVLNEGSFDALSYAQRQQAMLQGATIEGYAEIDELRKCNPVFTDYELPYDFEPDESIELHDGKAVVNAVHALLTLSFDCPPDCELYVQMKGLDYQGSSTRPKIVAECDGASAFTIYYTPYDIYSRGRSDFLLNLGYSNDGRISLTLDFDAKGEYDLSGLAVICQPMTGFEERIEALREDTLRDVEFGANKISGHISLDKPKLLCLSLPYSEGWSAMVDGEPAETIRTNTLFTGLMLPAGEHEVVLTYETPYIRAGLEIAGISFVLTILIGLYRHRIVKSTKREERKAVSQGTSA